MDKKKENALMNCNTLDELLNVEFGEAGTALAKNSIKRLRLFVLPKPLGKNVFVPVLPFYNIQIA